MTVMLNVRREGKIHAAGDLLCRVKNEQIIVSWHDRETGTIVKLYEEPR